MTDSETLFQSQRFRVVRATQTTPDGLQRSREVIRHPGAVAILPLLDDGRICLIYNYRVSVGQTLIEIPAGTLEPGEDPDETARRELIEETGYRPAAMQRLTAFYASPGILDERMYLYVATGIEPGATDLQPDEDIRPLLVPFEEALEMVRDGRIQDAKSLAGLLYYDKFHRRK
jgi:ADP-ribose pyrophosphatase